MDAYNDPCRDKIYAMYCRICDDVYMDPDKRTIINIASSHYTAKTHKVSWDYDVREFQYVRDLEEKEYYE